ncbi:hypothetical protein ACWDR0_29690 [Streptomyces sp. NPDC003691]
MPHPERDNPAGREDRKDPKGREGREAPPATGGGPAHAPRAPRGPGSSRGPGDRRGPGDSRDAPGAKEAPVRCGGGKGRPLLHGFRPGRATAGTAVLVTALLFAGDAAGDWSTPWYVVFPVAFGGLTLAGAVGLAHYGLRRRRFASSASRDGAAVPASTSGSQAIK